MPYPYLPPEIPPIVKSVVTESVSSDHNIISDNDINNDINSFQPSLKNTVKSRAKSSANSRLLSVLKSANSSHNSRQTSKSPKSLVSLELTDENIQSIDINNNHAENSLTERKESLLTRFKKQEIETQGIGTAEGLSDDTSISQEIDQSFSTWQPDKVKQKELLNQDNLLNKLRQNDHAGNLQIINKVETTGNIKASENLKDLADLNINSQVLNSQLPVDHSPSLKSSNSQVKSQKNLPDTIDFENDPLTNYSNSRSNSFQTNNLDQNIQPIKPLDQLTGDRPSAKNSVVNNSISPEINKTYKQQRARSLTNSIRQLKNNYHSYSDQTNISAIPTRVNDIKLSKGEKPTQPRVNSKAIYSKVRNFIPVPTAKNQQNNQQNLISATRSPSGLNTNTVLYKLPSITSPFDAQQVNSQLLGDTLEIGLSRPFTLSQNTAQSENNQPQNYRLTPSELPPSEDLDLPALEPRTDQPDGENNDINNPQEKKVIDPLEKYRRRRSPGETTEETPQPNPTTPVINVPVPEDVIEITANQQEFNEQQQTVSAQGDVVVRFRDGVLTAERVQVNLVTRQLQAQGEAAIARGEQILQGDRIEFNLTLQTGVVDQARGTIYAPTSGTDLAPLSPTLPTVGGIATSKIPLSERLQLNQPAVNVKEQPGVSTTIGGGRGFQLPGTQGQVDRLRFEAERIDLTGNGGWTATNLRLTNDPFSPPEIELRANQATFTKLSPLQDELITTNSRLVFDQKYSVPIFKRRTVIDRTEREPFPVQFGYDQKDRGGLFVQGSFNPLPKGKFNLKLTPQFYIQRAINGTEGGTADLFGLKASLDGNISPQTKLFARADFLTFDGFPDIPDDKFRASARLQHIFGQRIDGTGYTLTGEYSYRDRLFNGSLGYQTVHNTIGLVFTSPDISLGRKGAKLRFQTAFQNINARTDRRDLLDLEVFEPIPDDDDDPRGRADLNRFQTAVSVNYPIRLWSGKALPATKEEGLRYTPTPIVPFVQLILGASAATSIYSNDESQSYIRGSVGLIGQFGHLSRKYFDYTGFNIIYSISALDGESPFYFDRVVDTSVLTVGFVQQIVGGLKVGIQNSFSFSDDGGNVDNEFTIEYSRRSYGVILRYSPRRELGTILLRISDFNWSGGTNTFDDVQNVNNGVVGQ
jgi:hypothetical protein